MPSTVEFGALPHAMQIFCQKCTADTAIPAHGCGGGSNGAGRGSVPGSGVSDGGVSVPDVRGPSRESLW
ncbi:hypothetical protein MAHJHV47_32540 [Mycobacterium avium subsp. hominissuis]